jgi:hypothetical protein
LQKIIVYDDFFDDPIRIREVALEADYTDVQSLNYPGFQSVRSYASRSMRAAFESITGQALEIDPAKLTFGKFRIMLSSTGSRLKIHVDGAADWTGLIYLNTSEQCRGGTAFYRHRRSGLEGPPTEMEARRLGISNLEEFEAKIVEPDTLDTNAWEQTTFVGMRFNRLILFRGAELFHCHTCSWGTTKEDGRLTQNFFFNSSPVFERSASYGG